MWLLNSINKNGKKQFKNISNMLSNYGHGWGKSESRVCVLVIQQVIRKKKKREEGERSSD